MEFIKLKLRDWTVRHADGPYAKRWLAFFSFAEASFFPIPPDVILVSILTARQSERWKYYAFITTLWSVLGGIFGYAIGLFLYDSVGMFLVQTYHLEQYIDVAREIFRENAFWAVFVAGFTPIPYKVFTISAGFFSINFFVFVVASILSRALRFFSVGYIMKVFGKEIGAFVFKYFNILTWVFAGIIIVVALSLTFF